MIAGRRSPGKLISAGSMEPSGFSSPGVAVSIWFNWFNRPCIVRAWTSAEWFVQSSIGQMLFNAANGAFREGFGQPNE
jgi:hypothetical protein